MIFTIIMSVLLVFAAFSLFLTGLGKMIPSGVKLIPLIELALLWLYQLVLREKGGWPATLFLVQYWIVFILFVLPAAGGLWVIETFDREKKIEPVVIGDQATSREIAVVYHPGGSPFTGETVRKLGERLGTTEYKVVLYSVHKDLKLDPGKYAALGLASPVYAGRIRPPLERFIAANDLTGLRCFVLLTGGGSSPEQDEKDMESIVPLIEERGGQVAARIKIAQSKTAGAVEARIDEFARDLAVALAK